MKIAIDIGHADGTGSVGNGVEEHEACSRIAQALEEALEQHGHSVAILDFPGESNTRDLTMTAALANNLDIDFGLSLHCDCAGLASARGAHVCYTSKEGHTLASYIAGILCDYMPGRAKHVVKRDDLYILKHTRAPWVLCECGFLSNSGDVLIIRDSPRSIANAIACGIYEYSLSK